MSFTIFQQKLITKTQQLVMDNLNVFNAASNGAIVLGTGQVIKDFVETMTVGIIEGLVTERDAYAAPGTKADHKTLARLLTNSVNFSAKVGPVTITNAQLAKIEADVNQAASEVAVQATQAILQYYIGAGVGCAVAAIGSNSKAITTQVARANPNVTGGLFPTLSDFPLASIPFGDQSSLIRCWAMTGAQWLQFEAYQAVPSAEKVFSLGDLKVMQDGFGNKFLISDAVGKAVGSVVKTGTTKFSDVIVGLVPGAVAVTTNGLKMAAQPVVGEENLRTVWQGEFDFGVSVKGYRAKKAVTDAATGETSLKLADVLKTASWELDQGQVGKKLAGQTADQAAPARDIKETAGVLLQLTATTAPATA